jgi:hypothetical protein
MTFTSVFSKILRPRKSTLNSTIEVNQGELILISSDTSFFASLVHATTTNGWKVHWARSIAGAAEILTERLSPIIVYDCGLVPADWSASIDRLMSASYDPCIVLAAGLVSEELWREALSRRVYDVVSRAGRSGHLVATLQFAAKWRSDRRSYYAGRWQHRKLQGLRALTAETSVGSSYDKPLTR